MSIWDKSALEYSIHTPKITFYDRSSSLLVNLADLQLANSVADLGCGSTAIALKKAITLYPNIEHAFGIDSSHRMIEIAQKNNVGSRMKFYCCEASETHETLPFEVDRIIVNSAFWLFQLDTAINSIYKSLKIGGQAIFNIAEWDYQFDSITPHPKYEAIDAQLIERGLHIQKSRGSREKISPGLLNETIRKAGFDISGISEHHIEATREDWKSFYSMDTLRIRSMPDLSPEISKDLYIKAIDSLNENEFPPLKWIFYKIEKR